MMPIKLVHFTSSLKIGGAETVLFGLVEELIHENFDQIVFYIHDGPYRERLEKLGIPCCQISGCLFRYDVFFFWRLYCLLKKLRPDCLHTLLWSANNAGRIVARLLGIPVVSVIHNNVEQDGLLRNILDRCTIRAATRLVAVSDEVAQGILHQYRVKPALEVIKNGVDGQEIGKKSALLRKQRSDFGFGPEHLVIGTVGRLEPVKRYDLLLEGFAVLLKHVSHARLLIVGSGSQEVLLRDQAEKRGLLGVNPQVQFVHDSPAYGYYPLMDLFVQTSDKEGISIALLEAMSLGVACVVTHNGVRHPVITHGVDGLVIRPGDPGELSRALTSLEGNQQFRKELGVCAQKKVQQEFSRRAMHAAYTHLFASLAPHRVKI